MKDKDRLDPPMRPSDAMENDEIELLQQQKDN